MAQQAGKFFRDFAQQPKQPAKQPPKHLPQQLNSPPGHAPVYEQSIDAAATRVYDASTRDTTRAYSAESHRTQALRSAESPHSRKSFQNSFNYLKDLIWQSKSGSDNGASHQKQLPTTPVDFYVPPRSPASTPGMGNGASAKQVFVEGEAMDTGRIQQLVPQLQHQVTQYSTQIDEQKRLLRASHSELEHTRKQLYEKDREIKHLRGEIDKLKSVLQVKVHEGRPDILDAIQEEAAHLVSKNRNKKQGVSGESSQSTVQPLQHFDKDFR